jgi:hypothetical protein
MIAVEDGDPIMTDTIGYLKKYPKIHQSIHLVLKMSTNLNQRPSHQSIQLAQRMLKNKRQNNAVTREL